MAVSVETLSKYVDEAFSPTGPFSKIFDGYNLRKDQVALAQTFAKGLATGRAAFGEAGTGTGKSFATLVPAAIYAALEGTRVLVVTHNIALQQQLYDGDIPIVQQVLDLMGLEFKPALLKGKQNFLCTKHLAQEVKTGSPALKEELKLVLDDIRNENGQIVIGDKDKMSCQPSEALWSKISVHPNTDCSNCPFKSDSCFIEFNKQKAAESNLIISNQFMLMNDLVSRRKNNYAPNSGTLPDYGVVIVDEAHHLEEVASGSMASTVEKFVVDKLIRRMRKAFSDNGPLKDYHFARRQKLNAQVDEVENMYNTLFKIARKRLDEKKYFSNYIEEPYEIDHDVVKRLALDCLRNKAYIEDFKTQKLLDGFASSLDSLHKALVLIQEGVRNDDPEFIFWANKQGEEGALLTATPLEVNTYLREGLFERMPVLLSSATMKFDSDIDFFAKKVGKLEPHEYESIFIPAPFDYENQVCFYVPRFAKDAPPSGNAELSKAYDDYCLNEMYELVKMSKGRAFLLFTSNSYVNQYYEILAPKFEAMGYKCFRQGGDLDRNQMISEFIKHGNAVLFGANTFWEGISVKGRELSLVVVHKIPFDVPNPVSKAREAKIKENGGDIFLEGQVFPAIIKYKQGFGRLIRHEDDKGVFCVLDGRIFSKKDRYGKYFLRGTPKCQRTVDRQDLIPFFE